jgi:hypothetical protein
MNSVFRSLLASIKMAALSTSYLVKIDTPPQELLRPLSADARGVVFIRE